MNAATPMVRSRVPKFEMYQKYAYVNETRALTILWCEYTTLQIGH